MFDGLLGFIVLSGPLFALAVYFVVVTIAGIVALVARRGWIKLITGCIALGMLGFAYWDYPVLWEYRELCDTQAGFFQHQTLDEWKAENPGVAETLEPIDNAEWSNDGSYTRVPLNQRFQWVFGEGGVRKGIRKREERIVDIKTGAVLARYIDFSSGMKPGRVNYSSPRTYKYWLNVKSCESGDKPEIVKFNGYQQSIELIRRN